MVDRHVHTGVLGCPNCRDSFPVTEGCADLRAPPRELLDSGLGDGAGGTGEPARRGASRAGGTDGAGAALEAKRLDAEAERLVALLGIIRGPGTVALVGAPARLAGRVAEAVDELQVVAVDPGVRLMPDHPLVTRMVTAPGLPLLSHRLRGVVVDGALGSVMIAEAARVVSPNARTIIVDAPDDAAQILEGAGLSVMAVDAGTVVAARG